MLRGKKRNRPGLDLVTRVYSKLFRINYSLCTSSVSIGTAGSLLIVRMAMDKHKAVVRLHLCRDDVEADICDEVSEGTALTFAAHGGHEAEVWLPSERKNADADKAL